MVGTRVCDMKLNRISGRCGWVARHCPVSRCPGDSSHCMDHFIRQCMSYSAIGCWVSLSAENRTRAYCHLSWRKSCVKNMRLWVRAVLQSCSPRVMAVSPVPQATIRARSLCLLSRQAVHSEWVQQSLSGRNSRPLSVHSVTSVGATMNVDPEGT